MGMGLIGPCAVKFGDDDISGDASGSVYGDTVFNAPVDAAEVHFDEQGSQPSGHVMTGRGCRVTVPFTNLQLARLALVTAGAPGTGTTGDQVVVKNPVGIDSYDNAKTLILKRVLENGVVSTDLKDWITIYKAYPLDEPSYTFNVSSQRITAVIFHGYPVRADAVGMKRNWLYKIGNLVSA